MKAKKAHVKRKTTGGISKNHKKNVLSKQIAANLKNKESNDILLKTASILRLPDKQIDMEELDERLQKLKETEDTGNKKLRKKIRRLEYLKKKYTQLSNTEKSLSSLEPSADVENTADVNDNDNDSVMSVNEEGEATIEDDSNAGKGKEDVKDKTLKGIKRFVVFVGNLPKTVTEEELTNHFNKVGNIKSIRIQTGTDKKKGGFAFIEVEDSLSFEKTLSMHHTMLNNKRINVLYTNPDGANMDIKEIKKKNAKFTAMRKAGILAGSVPEHKKRSFRRKKKRLAEEKAAGIVR